MEAFLNKKYKLSKSENFDEFMRAMGVGLVARKMIGMLAPTIELIKEGDEYTLITVSTFRTMPLKFKLGEEFEELKPDGRKLKTVLTIEGNKLIQKQILNDKEVIIIRDYSDSEVIVESTYGDVVCKRVFVAVEQ